MSEDDGMSPEDLRAFAVKLIAVAETLQDSSRAAVQQLAQGVAHLQREAQAVRGNAQGFAQDALREIRAQARSVLEPDLQQAVRTCNQPLQEGARAVTQAAQQIESQRTRLGFERQAMVWQGLIALALGSLLTVAGTGYFAWKSMREIKQADFGADILRATQSGTLTRCGEALCARVGKDGRRYGGQGEYMLLEQ